MRHKSVLKLSAAAGFLLPVFGLVSGITPGGISGPDYSNDAISIAVPDTGKGDTLELPYPFHDNLTDPFSNPPNESPLYLHDPSNIESTIEYDPDENQYNINERMGDLFYRNPSYLTFDEYVRDNYAKSTKNYWREMTAGEDGGEKRSIIPKIYVGGEAFDRIFGGNTIDIRVQGSAELTFGLNIYKNENPAIPEKQRRNTTFDFDEKIQLNVVGNIGEKMKLTTNYNTEASFDFENKLKLEYTGKEDEIIKKLEAGNITMPLSGSLIQGSQSLFGIKAQLQFGRLKVTTVISQQEGQASTIDVPPGGGQITKFDIPADEYEANKHYFLSNYFKDNYDNALKNLPVVNSPINITKLEVWITNKNSSTENTRDIVAFMDLGEYNYYSRSFISQGTSVYPSDSLSNNLYDLMNKQYLPSRDINQVSQALDPLAGPPNNFAPQQDYVRLVGARKLNPNEYFYNAKLGYISLNQALNSNEVLAVAYEYTVGNNVFRVGDLTTSGINPPQLLFVKMLKSTNINPKLPTWDLMMKNVYSLGSYQLQREDFKLNVIYTDNNDGLKKINYMPVPASETNLKGVPLVQVFGVDQLDSRNDPLPDGVFDYVEGVTINSTNGRIYFPEREPFGSYLRAKFVDPLQANNYAYDQLYDSTKTSAQQLPELNRFSLVGSYKSSSSSEIFLNALNIPQGSVVVTAGGVQLVENVDYTVDYNLGRVKIINAGLLASATPIKISLESNSLFSIQSKALYGARFDYEVNKDFNVGGTFMYLRERPITSKVNIGDEPLNNVIWGLDGTYSTESRFITRMVDKLPFIATKEQSRVTVTGEFANLIPGTAGGTKGNAYIDDFEGSQSTIDLKIPSTWFLASVPQGQPSIFPEAVYNDSLIYGFNRAKLAWYNIDPTVFYRSSGSGSNLLPPGITNTDLSNNNVREVLETELFPYKQNPTGQATTLSILNLAYYPDERGPYNFDVGGVAGISAGINADGTLKNPNTRWAGIMRRIETYDFESTNVEFIQFWLMDPFNSESLNTTGGSLYFNLGEISEDILKDSYRSFEYGLPSPTNNNTVDSTVWGYVPRVQSIVNAFDNDPDSRAAQDVGLDGISTAKERQYHQAEYIQLISNLFGQGSVAYQNADADPAGDDFHYFRGGDYDQQGLSILERYKQFNGTEGNSKTSEQSPEPYTTSSTNFPDGEDINRDNTMSDYENYYQYKVDITPGQMNVGTNYIVDKITTSVTTKDNSVKQITWYQFKIPVNSPTAVIGTGADLKSVNFIRMFMKDFSEPMVMRFAKLELLRGEWRKYQYSLLYPGEYIPTDPNATPFDVSVVNLEENGDRTPIRYVLPPGIDREVNVGSTNLQQLNEQSLTLKVCNLVDGDARAAYKNTLLDSRNYKKIKMYLHAEDASASDEVQDGEVTAFIRLGSDFTNNYYEYEVPLKITRWGASIDTDVWPEGNNIVIDVDKLIAGKLERNNVFAANGNPSSTPYTFKDENRNITIVGNPTLSEVKTIMLGIRNPKKELDPNDDGQPKCVEVWFNELRMNDFDNNGGWAANARVTTKLADLGTVTLSGSRSTDGFGSLESKINDRQKENITSYDLSTAIEIGKFFPQSTGISIPFYFGFGETFSNPQYNPIDPDVPFDQALSSIDDPARKEQLRLLAQDYTKRQSINFTNVHKNRTAKAGKPKIYDIENFNLSFGYTNTYHRNFDLEHDNQKEYLGALGYNYSTQSKYITPFSKVKAFQKSKWTRPIKDFNLNFVPSSFTFRTDIQRHYGERMARDLSEFTFQQPTLYNKSFTWGRQYTLAYDITRSIKFDFTANNLANVDEPYGKIDTEAKKDSVRKNFWDFGRNTDYRHTGSLSYNVPLSKLPLTDWITLNLRYQFDYHWQTGPLGYVGQFNQVTINPAIGNTIQNSNTKQANTTFNMTTLYNKSKYLKKVLGPKPPKPPKPKVEPPKSPQDTTAKPKIKTPRVPGDVERSLAKVIFSMKNVSLNYSETNGTLLPGFNRTSEFLGNNFYNGPDGKSNMAPGLPFVFGSQKDIREEAARNNWLTLDTTFNGLFAQTYTDNFTGRATFEPTQGFRLELNASRNYARSKSENYRAQSDGSYNAYSHIETGNFSMSIISLGTAFAKDRKDYSSAVFEKFEAYRKEISLRLGSANSLSSGLDSAGYADGYGGTSQDVLTYAFLAAYTKKSAGGIKLDAFPNIPKVNWRLTYDGLSRLKFAKKLFNSVSLSHAYRSTYSVSSFTSNLLFNEDGTARDLSNNFIPHDQYSQVNISEQFSPLIGIDVNWKNRLTTRFEYKRDRNITLTFTDIQITEVKGTEFVFGAGYRWRNFKLPFGLANPAKKSSGTDLNLTADFSVRKNSTIIRKLLENLDQPTAGLTVLSMKLAADYIINERFNVRLFFDRIINTPIISTSFPTANTAFGISVRFTLTQ
ncbi:MAG TPA: cell surface protein SprA [Bacteroidia bacterium]|nr:cell surface protein SprA [Bacteroidia bacterium]